LPPEPIPPTFEKAHDLEPRRGLRICPKCHRRSLHHTEVDTHDVSADRGAVVCTRSYECSTTGCSVFVRFYEVSAGVVEKKTTRQFAERRPQFDGESSAKSEVLPGRIILKI
jgi:transcription elongation factor Elf1